MIGLTLQANHLGQWQFARLVKLAKVKLITFHGVWHTCAALLQGGEPVHVVSKRLGHARVETTLNTYAHVLPDMQKQAAVVRKLLEGKRAQDLPGAANVIGVIVTRDVIVNLRHPERLQVANRLRTLVENTVVEQHHLPKGRDQHGAVSLSDVHVVDLKGSIRLRECHRRQAQQSAQSVRHSQLGHEISPVVRVERKNHWEGRSNHCA